MATGTDGGRQGGRKEHGEGPYGYWANPARPFVRVALNAGCYRLYNSYASMGNGHASRSAGRLALVAAPMGATPACYHRRAVAG